MSKNAAGDPIQFVILDDSQITAKAFEGRGGNIDIQAEVLLASPESLVDASSERGIDGQVNVGAPVSDISGTFALLPEGFLATDALLHKRCAERVGEALPSSFVVRRRDGAPLGPNGVLVSRLVPHGSQGEPKTQAGTTPQADHPRHEPAVAAVLGCRKAAD